MITKRKYELVLYSKNSGHSASKFFDNLEKINFQEIVLGMEKAIKTYERCDEKQAIKNQNAN